MAPPPTTPPIDEVGQGVYVVRAPFFGARLHLPVLVGPAGALIVDSGAASTPREVLLPALGRLGVAPRDVRWVLITHAHADHAGGVAALLDACPRARLLAGAADARAVADPEVAMAEAYGRYAVEHQAPYPADVLDWVRSLLGPGRPVDDRLPADQPMHLRLDDDWIVEARAIPGHTAGHAAVWDPRSRSALIGDGALWRGCVDASDRVLSGPPYVDAAGYRRSATSLAELELERLVTAHYADRVGRAAAREFLAETEAFSRGCATVVQDLVEGGLPVGVTEAADALDAAYGPMSLFAQWYPVALAELEALAAEGRAQAVPSGGRRLWRRSSA
jgi:glyoxylase-like metal-dependent hydrolase (beta-lactamase superfamily II)